MQKDLLAAAQEAMRTMEELKQARQESDRIRSQSTVTQDSDGRNQWPERPPGIELGGASAGAGHGVGEIGSA